jgi:hypothetical protein
MHRQIFERELIYGFLQTDQSLSQKIYEIFYGGERMKAVNELFVETLQNLIKINVQHREFFKANENVDALNVVNIELFQKLNKQWIEFLWGPFLANVRIQDK